MRATLAATRRIEKSNAPAMWKPRGPRLNPENSGVACPDFFAEPLHRSRVLLHQLDFPKRPPAGLLLDLGVERTHRAPVDHELLAFRAVAEALEQPRRIGIGRRLEEA